MKDYRRKIYSGGRDKIDPTPRRDLKVHPKLVAGLVSGYKKVNDKSFKDFGFKPYTGKFINDTVRHFVRRSRKGIV